MAKTASGDQASTNVVRGGSANPVSASGLRSRVQSSKASASKSTGKTTSGAVPSSSAGKSGFSIRLYDDDAPGLKVSPTSVLITSLVYIGSVILLHIWGKFRSPAE